METVVKEHIKSKKKKIQAQNTQEIRDTVKRPNLHITGIEEEETQIKSTENIFDKNHRRKFPLTKIRDTYLVTRRAQNIK